MHQLYLHEATKPKASFFLTSWGLLPFISEQFSPTISATLKKHITGKKVQVCSFLPLSVALDLALCLQREREREREAKGRHGKARVHTAERCSRKASCQPPAEGKTTGHLPEQFGKRTSQGRFQLAQHVVTAVSHRGWEEDVGGSLGLREGERKESRYGPRQTELKAEIQTQTVISIVLE